MNIARRGVVVTSVIAAAGISAAARSVILHEPGTGMRLAGAQRSVCLPVDDGAAVFRGYAQFLITATDSPHVKLRTRLGLPAIDTSRVGYVSDPAACTALVRAINAAMRSPRLVTRVYVLSVGRMYFVQDPDARAGEWTPAFTLTRDYRFVGLVAL